MDEEKANDLLEGLFDDEDVDAVETPADAVPAETPTT